MEALRAAAHPTRGPCAATVWRAAITAHSITPEACLRRACRLTLAFPGRTARAHGSAGRNGQLAESAVRIQPRPAGAVRSIACVSEASAADDSDGATPAATRSSMARSACAAVSIAPGSGARAAGPVSRA